MNKKEQACETLRKIGIAYDITEHRAVFTIEEMALIPGIIIGDVCKNLFLRDGSGKRHFLVVLRGDKQADLKAIKNQIGSSRLGFASEERLAKYLGLTKGSVTPLGIINDANHEVELLIDSDLRKSPRLGVHPNDNRATIWITFDGLEKIINHFGNSFRFIEI